MFNVNVSNIVRSLNPWDGDKSSNDNTRTTDKTGTTNGNSNTNTKDSPSNSIYDNIDYKNLDFDSSYSTGELTDQKKIDEGKNIAINFFNAINRDDLVDHAKNAIILPGTPQRGAEAQAFHTNSGDYIYIKDDLIPNVTPLRVASDIVQETVHLDQITDFAEANNITNPLDILDSQDWEREAITMQDNFHTAVGMTDIDVDKVIREGYSYLPEHPSVANAQA